MFLNSDFTQVTKSHPDIFLKTLKSSSEIPRKAVLNALTVNVILTQNL